MKSYWTLILVCFLCISQSIAQEVPEQQRPLISKVAATWCPPCGSWGWEMFEDLVDENEENATLLVAHHSGDLTNSVAQDFSSNFSAPYQPYFYYNITDQNVTSSNRASKLVEINDQVNAALLESPIANAGISMFANGNELEVKTKTKFFQEATGEYYLGVYFVESNIINFQARRGDNAVHEKILRASISSGSFGEFLGSGTIATGTEFSHEFDASLEGMDIEHLEVITIIWKKEGETYDVVNTNISTEFSEPTSSEEINISGTTLNVFPAVINSSATISLNVEEALNNTELALYNRNGQKIQSIHSGNLSVGSLVFELTKTDAITQGLFYLVLRHEGKLVSRSVIFE